MESKVNFSSISLIFLCALPGLASCASQPPIQDGLLPGLDIPGRNINTFIVLSDPDILENTHRNGDDLTLHLINLSGQDIIFPDNFGVRVAANNGETWKEIENSYRNPGMFLLPTEKSSPGGLLLGVRPYIPNLPSSIQVRVVVIGHIGSMEGLRAAAYIDVTLKPWSVIHPSSPLLVQLVH